MKTYVSEAAKELVKIIGTEYSMAESRVRHGFIAEETMFGTVIERLNRLAISNTDLRHFLDTKGFIPTGEDEHMDHEWAEDPRDDSFHEVHLLNQERREEMPPEVRKLGKGGLL